jgi:alpha-glucosidase
MIGPAIMQAPFVTEDGRTRSVLLPAARWYAAECAGWVEGGRSVTAAAHWLSTPLYVRDGSIVPMAAGEVEGGNTFDGRAVEFHVFVSRACADSAQTEYVFDDGLTYAYQEGKRSRLRVTAKVSAGRDLAIETALVDKGYGPCTAATFVLYDRFRRVTLNGKPVKIRKTTWQFAGVEQQVSVVG